MDQMRREILTWTDVDALIEHLLPQFEGEFDAMVMITRGGIIPGGLLAEAMDIVHILTAAVDFPAQMEMEKTGLYAWPNFLQFPEDRLLRERRTLVVDDVWGSGRTITTVKNRVVAAGGYPYSCVLHFNPYRSLFTAARPEYYAAITDAHIVYPWEIDRGADRVLLDTSPHPSPCMPDPSTTRIALIGDVHANLPALDAVLAHAHQRSVRAIWNVGDFVGYGPFPEEVVGRLRQERATSILGNYDIKVLKFPKRQEKWRKSKHPQKWLAFQWAYEHLSRDSLKYLRSLPEEIWTKQHGKQFLLTHGSPASNEEPLTPDTPEARLDELARLTAEKYGSSPDAILCGHSHRAFTRQVAGIWFINTGSVGRPNDGDPRTGYAILELGPDRFAVEHYRLEYDVQKAVAAIRANSLPESFAEMLLRGLDLDTALL